MSHRYTETRRRILGGDPQRRPSLCLCVSVSALSLLCASTARAQTDDSAALAEQQKALRDVVAKVSPGYVFIGGGSGVCVSADGWILTNHHVAGGQKTWKLRFSGGKEFTADLVGWHPLDDVAVLKIRGATDLPFVPLGNSDAVKVGVGASAGSKPSSVSAPDPNGSRYGPSTPHSASKRP